MELETGAISFCGKRALNIKSDDYKKSVLDNIVNRHGVYHNKRNYQTYKPTHEGMVRKYAGASLSSVVSSGNAYLLYITKDEYSGKNQVFFIDCKTCDGYAYPRIVMLWIRFQSEVYNNTLLRGELVRDRSNNWIFIIDDMMTYCGRELKNVKKAERVKLTAQLLNRDYIRDNNLELMWLRMKRYFTVGDTDEITQTFIPSLNYDTRGFTLHLSNGINIFMHTGSNKTNRRERRRGDKKTVVTPKKKRTKRVDLSATKLDYKTERHIASSKKNIKMTIEPEPSTPLDKSTVTLLLKETEQPDVYKLYAMKAGVRRRVSYAHVPSIEISKMLNDATSGSGDVLVECSYNSIFDKWTPLRITDGAIDSVSTVKSIKKSKK